MCWKEKGYSKPGPLLMSPAWPLITSYFCLCSSKIEFHSGCLVDISTHSVSCSHGFLPLGPCTDIPCCSPCLTKLVLFRKYQNVPQNVDNCGSSQNGPRLPKSMTGVASLCSLWLPELGSLRALTTLCYNCLHILMSPPLDLRSLKSSTTSYLSL